MSLYILLVIYSWSPIFIFWWESICSDLTGNRYFKYSKGGNIGDLIIEKSLEQFFICFMISMFKVFGSESGSRQETFIGIWLIIVETFYLLVNTNILCHFYRLIYFLSYIIFFFKWFSFMNCDIFDFLNYDSITSSVHC